MSTKNLVKTTVASFLLFGLSTISAKAMEPEIQSENRSQLPYSFRFMPESPSRKDLNQLKPRELGVFFKEDGLYCYIHSKKEMKILSSVDVPKGLPSESFDKILKTLQYVENPRYAEVALTLEEEKQQTAAHMLYNQAFEKITLEDEKALLQYILLRDPTLMTYITNEDIPFPRLAGRDELKYSTYIRPVDVTWKKYAECLSIPFCETLEKQYTLLKNMRRQLRENHPIPIRLAVNYVITRMKGYKIEEAFFVDAYSGREPNKPDALYNRMSLFCSAVKEREMKLPEGLRVELDALSEPFKESYLVP